MINGGDLFREQFLVGPREISGAPGLLRSRTAILHIGSVRVNDIVWLVDGRCGRIVMFYELSANLVVCLDVFSVVLQDPTTFDERQSMQSCIDPRTIVDSCTWVYDQPHIVRVVIPPLFLVSM